MVKQKWADSLVMYYKALDDQGRNMSKSVRLNNLGDEASDGDLFEVSKLIGNLMAYATESVHRISDYILLEN